MDRYNKCIQEVADTIEAISAIGRALGGEK
jgi:hypothetical protein